MNPEKPSQPSGTADRPFHRSRVSGMVIGFIALAQVVFILYMLRYVPPNIQPMTVMD